MKIIIIMIWLKFFALAWIIRCLTVIYENTEFAFSCNAPLHTLPPLGSQPMVGIKSREIILV